MITLHDSLRFTLGRSMFSLITSETCLTMKRFLFTSGGALPFMSETILRGSFFLSQIKGIKRDGRDGGRIKCSKDPKLELLYETFYLTQM